MAQALLQMEEAFMVKEYKHTHTYTYIIQKIKIDQDLKMVLYLFS